MSRRRSRTMRTLHSRQRRSKKRTLLRIFGAKCALCTRAYMPEELILKNIVHRSQGGSNALDNLHLICHRCNHNGRVAP